MQSDIVISGFDVAVEGCFVNSLKAGSTQVLISVYREDLSFKIEDNGTGITYEELEQIGESLLLFRLLKYGVENFFLYILLAVVGWAKGA